MAAAWEASFMADPSPSSLQLNAAPGVLRIGVVTFVACSPEKPAVTFIVPIYCCFLAVGHCSPKVVAVAVITTLAILRRPKCVQG